MISSEMVERDDFYLKLKPSEILINILVFICLTPFFFFFSFFTKGTFTALIRLFRKIIFYFIYLLNFFSFQFIKKNIYIYNDHNFYEY